jgi:DNA-directed RNA polymerase subunit RPC12/RpoP
MPEKEYGCNCCNVIFAEEEQNKAEDKAVVECPQCGSIDVQKLDEDDSKPKFIRRMAYGGG